MTYATINKDFESTLPPNAQIIGAKIIEGSEDVKNAVIAIKDGANTIIKLIDGIDYHVDSIIDEVIEVGTPLFLRLEAFFNDIFNHLPTYIEKKDQRYQLTLFPARGKKTDVVAYLRLFDHQSKLLPNPEILFQTEASTMFKAKNEMHKLLESKSYL